MPTSSRTPARTPGPLPLPARCNSSPEQAVATAEAGLQRSLAWSAPANGLAARIESCWTYSYLGDEVYLRLRNAGPVPLAVAVHTPSSSTSKTCYTLQSLSSAGWRDNPARDAWFPWIEGVFDNSAADEGETSPPDRSDRDVRI